jgi:hypothetical protein
LEPLEHQDQHAPRPPFTWTVMTSLVLALLFLPLLGTPVHEFAQTRMTLPVLFKVREWVGKAPTIHPKLKIFAYDDTSFAKQGLADLALPTWAKILKGIAERNPKAIYIDKLFSLPPDPGPQDIRAIEDLTRLRSKIVSVAFARPTPIRYREPLVLDGPLYQLSSYFDRIQDTLLEGFIPMENAFDWHVYGADHRLAGVFRRAGHSLNAGYGKASALIQVGRGKVLPHMVLMGSDRLKIKQHTLFVDGTQRVPLDPSGRMIVDFAPPASYGKHSRRILNLIDKADRGEPQTEIEAGDFVLLLPHMYTGNTDFTVTPVGPMPGPYVVASLLNSLTKNEWIAPSTHDGTFVMLAILIGVILGHTMRQRTWLGVLGMVSLWIATSCYFFIYRHILLDLTSPISALNVSALVAATQAAGLGDKLALFLRIMKRENATLRREIDHAGAVASVFLPHKPPRWSNMQIGAFHKSLWSASGDWYAFEESSDGSLRHFVLCDISGHGMQAAIIVSTAKTVINLMRQEKPELFEQRDFVAHYARVLNMTLFQNGQTRHLTTLTGFTLDMRTGELWHLSCGHPSPILIRHNLGDPAVERLISSHNLLGLQNEIGLTLRRVIIRPKDQLLMYTDGVRLPRSHKHLIQRLEELRGYDLEEAAGRLVGVDGSTPPTFEDDVSLVWFRFLDLGSDRKAA